MSQEGRVQSQLFLGRLLIFLKMEYLNADVVERNYLREHLSMNLVVAGLVFLKEFPMMRLKLNKILPMGWSEQKSCVLIVMHI